MSEREAQVGAPMDAARGAFEFLNRWADRVFVISLPRAHDRRARMTVRLAGLAFAFADGVDKLDLDRERLVREGDLDESRAPRSYRHRSGMKPGEIGAALAHRRLYADAVANGWRRIVVLEDDAVPRAEELAGLPAALSQLPDDFDLCYLGYMGRERATAWDRAKQATYVALGSLGVVPWSPREAIRLHSRRYSPNLRRAGLHMCAHAYAISLQGASKLLEAQTPLAFRADWVFPYLILRGRLSAYVTAPRLFDQEGPAELPPGAPKSYIHG